MPPRINLESYHKNIGKELWYARDKIRNLIGKKHYLSDGEHKEAVLRSALRKVVPNVFQIKRGFVHYGDSASKQIDIILIDGHSPTLFMDGDLVVVMPEAVRALIEVKTSHKNLNKEVCKFAREVENIRSKAIRPIWSGFFVFEHRNLAPADALNCLRDSANGVSSGCIDCFVWGRNNFIKFWNRGNLIGSPEDGPVFHYYELHELSYAYFISNLIVHLANLPAQEERNWFPIPGGKETRRRSYAPLRNRQIYDF